MQDPARLGRQTQYVHSLPQIFKLPCKFILYKIGFLSFSQRFTFVVPIFKAGPNKGMIKCRLKNKNDVFLCNRNVGLLPFGGPFTSSQSLKDTTNMHIPKLPVPGWDISKY